MIFWSTRNATTAATEYTVAVYVIIDLVVPFRSHASVILEIVGIASELITLVALSYTKRPKPLILAMHV